MPIPTGYHSKGLDNEKIFSFPNPFQNQLTITTQYYSGNEYQLNLFDIFGKLVIEQRVSSFPVNINTEFLAKGIYEISLIENAKQIHTSKIIKR
jgi:hypothetical protein